MRRNELKLGLYKYLWPGNVQMAISQQEIVEMLRKLAPRVFQTYRIQILIKIRVFSVVF